jgi:hypothetical protein
MAESKIIIRMSQSSGIYNKSNKYEVIINNEAKLNLTMWITDKYFTESGRNIIEIKKWKYYNCKRGKYKNGQDLAFTINASVTIRFRNYDWNSITD